MGVRSTILSELKAVVETLPAIKKVEIEKIVNSVEDVNPSDIPYVQIFDVGSATVTQQKSEDAYSWPLAVELVMRQNENLAVDQTVFLDQLDELEDKIEENRGTLDVPGFQHLQYNSVETTISGEDDDIFAARLIFNALYLKDVSC